ncbi:MAG: membrane protein insertion efficiency factor YidD [Pseudomonadota bacterium]
MIIGIIRVYQLTLSSVFGRSCRYLPTCSEYTTDAVKLHGAWAGLWIGLARFARCNPLGGDGFDPAPERLPSNSRWYMPWRYGHWRTPPESVAPHAEQH